MVYRATLSIICWRWARLKAESDKAAAAIAATGVKIVSKLRKVTVLLYSDKARVHQRCCLNGNEFIFREQWQSSASHWRVTSRVVRLESLSMWRPVKGPADPGVEKSWRRFTRSWTAMRWGCREIDFKISERKILDNERCFKMESAVLWDGVTTVSMERGLGNTCQKGWNLSLQGLGCLPVHLFTSLWVMRGCGR